MKTLPKKLMITAIFCLTFSTQLFCPPTRQPLARPQSTNQFCSGFWYGLAPIRLLQPSAASNFWNKIVGSNDGNTSFLTGFGTGLITHLTATSVVTYYLYKKYFKNQ